MISTFFLVVLAVLQLADAATPTSIRFLNDASKSAVTAPDQSFTALQRAPISSPPIVLQLINDDGTVNTTVTDVTAYVFCLTIILSGTEVMFVNGLASFDSLTIKTCYNLQCRFVFFAGGDGVYPVIGSKTQTGDVTVIPIPNYDMRFTGNSYIQRGVATTATVNVAIPAILIQLLDSCGNDDPSNTGSTITVRSAPSGTLSGPLTATFTSGMALWTNVMYTDVPVSPSVLNFTADPASGFLVAGNTLASGVVTVSGSITPNFNIVFKNTGSQFTANGQGADVAVAVPFLLPVIVTMVNSAWQPDATNSQTVVTVTGGTAVTPVNATMVAGVATFTNMTFAACQAGGSVFLTFTAGTQGNTAASGKTTTTGAVSVTGVPLSLLAFANNSLFNASGQTASLPVSVVLPAIVLNIQDSCTKFDPSGQGLAVSVTSAEGAVLVGTTTATVSNGVATFNALTISILSTGTPKLTFTALGPSNAPVNGKTAVTGAITLVKPTDAPTTPPTARPTTAPTGTPSPAGPTVTPAGVPPAPPASGSSPAVAIILTLVGVSGLIALFIVLRRRGQLPTYFLSNEGQHEMLSLNQDSGRYGATPNNKA